MIRVLIVDDHPIVRKGLRWMLDEAGGMEVGGEAANGVEALEKLHMEKFDIVLLDISMPEKDGIDTLKEIINLESLTKVLILSIHPENKYAARLMNAGASGYITKEAVRQQLVEAIRTVAAGKKHISPYMAELLHQYNDNDAVEPLHKLLSSRECQMLSLLGSGKQLTEIAETLSLTSNVANFYQMLILKKIKMHSSAELAFYARQNGLVDGMAAGK